MNELPIGTMILDHAPEHFYPYVDFMASIGKKVKMNVNYTLDLTTSFNPINRISFSAKLLLGDKGRSLEQEQIDLLYTSGLMYYNKSQWQEAINEWEKILEIDKRYDPAIKGIKSAKTQLDIYNDVYENMFLSL